MKYRQSTKFGCGSYALANIFDDPRFVAELPTTQGERIADLQKKVNKYKRGLFINPIFITSQNLKVGNRLKFSQAELFSHEKGKLQLAGLQQLVKPYLIIVAKSATAMHALAVFEDCGSRDFIVVDSATDAPERMKLKELIATYHITAVCQFSSFYIEDHGNYVMMRREDIAHIIG